MPEFRTKPRMDKPKVRSGFILQPKQAAHLFMSKYRQKKEQNADHRGNADIVPAAIDDMEDAAQTVIVRATEKRIKFKERRAVTKQRMAHRPNPPTPKARPDNPLIAKDYMKERPNVPQFRSAEPLHRGSDSTWKPSPAKQVTMAKSSYHATNPQAKWSAPKRQDAAETESKQQAAPKERQKFSFKDAGSMKAKTTVLAPKKRVSHSKERYSTVKVPVTTAASKTKRR